MQILILTLVAEALGECCPNFVNVGTLALFKRREYAAQILTFILWLGHSLEHPKVAQLTSKSTPNRSKIIKNWGVFPLRLKSARVSKLGQHSPSDSATKVNIKIWTAFRPAFQKCQGANRYLTLPEYHA